LEVTREGVESMSNASGPSRQGRGHRELKSAWAMRGGASIALALCLISAPGCASEPFVLGAAGSASTEGAVPSVLDPTSTPASGPAVLETRPQVPVDALYALMISELALQRGDLAAAAAAAGDLALAVDDPRLSARAARIGLIAGREEVVAGLGVGAGV